MKAILNRSLYLFITFLIATEGLFVGQYMVAGIAGYRWLELLIFILLLKPFLADLKSNKFLVFYVKFLFLLIFFLGMKAGYLMFFEDYIGFAPFKQMMRIPFFLIVPYLIYYVAKKDIKYLKIILFVQVLIFAVAFFQFPLTPLTNLAWELKYNYFAINIPTGIINELGIDALKARVPSLYGYAIPFSYALVAGGILSAYLYQKTNSMIYMIAIIFMIIVAAMSLTRSAVLALLVLLLYVSFAPGKKRALVKYIVMLGLTYVLVTMFIEHTQSFSRISNIEGSSATGRIPLLITGVYTLFLNPLGVSPDAYNAVKEEMYAIFQHPHILEFTAHNGLVSFGFYYTLIGLFVFFYLLYRVKKKYLTQLTKQMKMFFIVAFFAYLLQAFFHNNFIFTKDFGILIIVALLMYEYKISKDKRVTNVK